MFVIPIVESSSI